MSSSVRPVPASMSPRGEQRPPGGHVQVGLGGRHPLHARPERVVGVADRADHRRQLVGLDRKPVIRPGRSRLSVKCFSITAAPSAVATIGAVSPGLWSL